MITGILSKRLHFMKYGFSTSYAEVLQQKTATRVQDVKNFEELYTKIYQTKPALYCIIFNQVGNTFYDQVNHMYNQASNKFVGYKFYRINVNNQDKTTKYFGVKNPPMSMIFGNGSPLAKHTGLGYQLLETKLQSAQTALHTTDFVSGTEQWEGPQDLWRANYNDNQEPFDYYAR